MTLADVLAAVLGIALALGGFGALALTFSLLVPERLGSAQRAASHHPVRSGSLGALLLLLTVGLASAGLKSHVPLGRLLGLGAPLATLLVAALGATAIARHLGGRLGGDGPPALLRGVTVAFLAGLLPLLGWFVVAPIGLLVSLGAGLSALRAPSPLATASPAQP